MKNRIGRQARHDPGEHAHITPRLPTIIEGLVRAILTVRAFSRTSDVHALTIAPAQTVAINEDNTAEGRDNHRRAACHGSSGNTAEADSFEPRSANTDRSSSPP